MSKPFDATLKDLIGKYPADWLAYLGIKPSIPVEVIDADLSTVTTQADRVLLVRDTEPWLLHLELQASHDADFSKRMLRYNALLYSRHGLPVHSAVFLLRREADDPALTGHVSYQPHAGGSHSFHFQVVRLWQSSPEDLLAGGLGTLPLTPLCAVSKEQMPELIQRMEDRLGHDRLPEEKKEFWTAVLMLLGLRFETDFAKQLLKGVTGMKESTTYQAILQEGKIEGIMEGIEQGEVREARKMLIVVGRPHLGLPSDTIRKKIDSITTLEELEALGGRVASASSWEALLG